MRKALAVPRKEVASRFYQLLSGYAAVAEHLLRVGQVSSDLCFWCGTGERQRRHHLLVRCKRWEPEIRKMWQRVRLDCEWRGAPSVRLLFGNERAVPAVLEFVEGTGAESTKPDPVSGGSGFRRGGTRMCFFAGLRGGGV